MTWLLSSFILPPGNKHKSLSASVISFDLFSTRVQIIIFDSISMEANCLNVFTDFSLEKKEANKKLLGFFFSISLVLF